MIGSAICAAVMPANSILNSDTRKFPEMTWMTLMGSTALRILGRQKFILNFRVRNSTETKKVSFLNRSCCQSCSQSCSQSPTQHTTATLPVVIRRTEGIMPENFELGGVDPVLMLIFGIVGVAIIIAMEDDFDETPQLTQDTALEAVNAIIHQATDTYNLYRRGRVDENGLPIPKRRRIVVNYDWQRARVAIFEDYMSPMPRFNDRFFERHFRVTRTIVEEIRLIAACQDTQNNRYLVGR
jgi:hypothetical protein